MFNHGINQQLLAQLLEVGLQSLLGHLSCPMECMAFDSVIFEQQNEWIHAAADRICSDLEDTTYKKKSVLTSCPPARDHDKELMTTPIVTEAISFAKNEQRDAFKRPAIPNATTMDEQYSFNYTDAEKQEAIGEIKHFLSQAQVEKQLLVLDRCQSTLGGTVQEALEQDRDLEFLESIFGDEINVHKRVRNGSGVLTTKPLHIGGDAQTDKTSIKTATLHSMTAAVLQIVLSRLAPSEQQQEQQDQQDENKRSIHEASFQYNAMQTNMHQNGRIAAVAYKHCNTPKSVDALRRSGLQGWDNDQSIAKNVKLMYQHAKNCKDENSKRPVERVIVSAKATNILSWPEETDKEVSDKDNKLDKEISKKISTEVPADLQQEVKHIIRSHWRIDDLFETKKNLALGSARWKQFRALFLQADTAACRHLVKIIDLAQDVVLKSNAGNKQERRHQQTNDNKEGNDTEFARTIPALLQDPAKEYQQPDLGLRNKRQESSQTG